MLRKKISVNNSCSPCIKQLKNVYLHRKIWLRTLFMCMECMHKSGSIYSKKKNWHLKIK